MALPPRTGFPSLRTMSGHMDSGIRLPHPASWIAVCSIAPASGIDTPPTKRPVWPQEFVWIVWVNAAMFPHRSATTTFRRNGPMAA